MNQRFFFLLLLLSGSLTASTYYIDNDAQEERSCRSQTLSCQLQHFLALREKGEIKLSAGDNIAFKRDQYFKTPLKFNNLHGEEKNPISLIAYGEGLPPILSSITNRNDFIWRVEAPNIWSTALRTRTSRVWRDGKEQLFANKDPLSSKAVWRWEKGRLYLYSSTQPKGLFSINHYYHTLYFKSCSHIHIENLKIEGGTNASIQIEDSQYFQIKNSFIGKNSTYGIVAKNSHYLSINRNIFDANFSLHYPKPIASHRENQGVEDGIYFTGTITHSHISYNDFINWGHAGFAATTKKDKDHEISHNRIDHNYFTADEIIYGRAIAYSGNTHHNEVAYNYIEKIHTQNQLSGHHNYFHHNVIDQVYDTPLREGQQGNGITIEDYALSNYDNKILYNTIMNTEGAGIAFIALGKNTQEEIFNNTIAHNYLLNCGTPKSKFRSLYLPHYRDIKKQYIYENAIRADYNRTIHYRKEYLSVDAFNKRNNLNKNHDQIYGNQSIFNPNKHGAGELKKIRYNAGSNAPF